MTRRDRTGRGRSQRVSRKMEAQPDALALEIEREDWERTALALALTAAVRMLPEATIDDVLALLFDDERRTDDGA